MDFQVSSGIRQSPFTPPQFTFTFIFQFQIQNPLFLWFQIFSFFLEADFQPLLALLQPDSKIKWTIYFDDIPNLEVV